MSLRLFVGLTGLSLLTLVAGCADDRRSGPAPGTDGGSTTDAGTTLPPLPPVPPGGVSVTIDSVSWQGEDGLPIEQQLVLAVRVASATDGTPAPLVYTAFSLETDLGAVLETASSSRSTCPEGISVAPGAALPCTVAFDVPPGQTPIRLRYTADATRMAMASISACSGASPAGLCDPGQVCRSGSCQTQCSSAAPEGFCPGADERCESGRCRGPCSASDPTGYCAEGACVDGACNTACLPLDFMAPGCAECAVEVVESCALTSPACADETACTNCVIGNGSTCGCEEACEGCYEQAVSGVACVLEVCPACNP